MAHNLIIWGDRRSMLAGHPPAAALADEVRSLASLEAALDGRGAALVLADPEQLAAERDAVESWLRNGGSARAVLVAVAAPATATSCCSSSPSSTTCWCARSLPRA